jgi:uncharacterized phiE125 gp8 family phage protein
MSPVIWNRSCGRQGSPLRIVSVMVTPPSVEPVSVDEAKLHLRVTNAAEDATIASLITAARQQVERDLGASLAPTVWDLWLDGYPSDDIEIQIPRWPLQAVLSITTYDSDDSATVTPITDYTIDALSVPGRIVLNDGVTWPTALRSRRAAVIRHVSGFGGLPVAISGITRAGGTATVTTSTPHGHWTGQRLTIAGADQADYNSTFDITVTGASTFTFPVSGAPVTPATGTMTATAHGVPVPERYKLAMLMLVELWYTQRSPVGDAGGAIPLTYETLIGDAPIHVV